MDMNFAGKRILVTGGASFIGSHLVEKLVKLGAEVIVADNLSSGKKENLNDVLPEITLHVGDLHACICSMRSEMGLAKNAVFVSGACMHARARVGIE